MASKNLVQAEPPRGLAGRVDPATEQLVRQWIGYAAKAMPASIGEEALERAGMRLKVAILAAAHPEKLRSCSPESIGKCIALSAMTQLYPGPGEMKPDVWLIPRDVKDRNGKVLRTDMNWQMGAAAYRRLARRAGFRLEPTLVFDGESFHLTLGTSPEISHEVNLDGEKNWETLRLGYIVVRDLSTGSVQVDWLNKKQIDQRRRKAMTDKVWKEWPLEQSLKTLCNYAGQREMFPLDEVTRAALAADNQAETGGLDSPESTARQMSAEMDEKANATPIALPPREPEIVTEEAAPAEPVSLSTETLASLKTVAKENGVSWEAIEEAFDGPIEELTAPTADEIKRSVLDEIRKRGKKAHSGNLPGVS